MTFALIAILALATAAAVITVLAVRNAPEGYQDETGFHAVRPVRLPATHTTRDLNSSTSHGNHLAGGLA
jgi:hypothetical protein